MRRKALAEASAFCFQTMCIAIEIPKLIQRDLYANVDMTYNASLANAYKRKLYGLFSRRRNFKLIDCR